MQGNKGCEFIFLYTSIESLTVMLKLSDPLQLTLLKIQSLVMVFSTQITDTFLGKSSSRTEDSEK